MPHVISPKQGARKNVLIVGAGPAGLAARVAAERGHQVKILEAASHAGGQAGRSDLRQQIHAARR